MIVLSALKSSTVRNNASLYTAAPFHLQCLEREFKLPNVPLNSELRATHTWGKTTELKVRRKDDL